MTNLQKRVVTAIATGAVLLSTVTPAFATQITISGNGSHTDNDADVSQSNSVNVSQNNDANIDNNISVSGNTGGNSASDNTGGDVKVKTGDSDVKVNVQNQANTNVANVNGCCAQDTKVNISGNGTGSDNNVAVDSDNDVDVDQDNDADFDNDIDVTADTGYNDADDNTGGDVTIETGDANVTAKVKNMANYNSAVLGGGDSKGGKVSAFIVGNGSHSDNDVDLDFDNDVDVDQDNDADFDNDLDLAVYTGDNDADDNTGGDVMIETGDADMRVVLDNMANFNAADIEGCGCVDDLKAAIEGNGTRSDSEIVYDSENDLDLDQDNDSDFDNDVDGDLNTGDNDADDNTGEWDGDSDPSVETGDSDADVKVNNSGNANVYGDVDNDDMLDGLNVTFDLDDLLSWLQSHMS